MFSSVQVLLLWLTRQVPALLVMGGLGALGVWGYHHEWKLRPMFFLHASEQSDDKAGKSAEEEGGQGAVTLASDDTARKAGIEVGVAKAQTMVQEVSAHAVLGFDQTRYAHLSTRAPGTAWRVLRQAGDRVKQGEVLALVASPDAGKARLEFLTALATVDIRNRALRVMEEAADSVPEKSLREARTMLREARLRLLTDQQTLANLGLMVREKDFEGLPDDKSALKLRLLGLPPRITDKADPALLPANLLPLVAPFDGLVIQRDVVAGEMVETTRPQFILADPSQLWIQLDVRQEDAGGLALGQEVEFRADSTGQSAVGKLTWISAEVDPKTRTVRARAQLENEGTGADLLRPATWGTATVRIRSQPAVTVPDGAIQFDGKGHLLFVQAGTRTFLPRLVLPGLRSGGYTEVFDSRALLPAQAFALLATPGGCWQAAASWPALEPLLTTPQPGDPVVTLGSHILRSELLKSRIGAED
jgi:cobalt-zinc-cadmium efflux system membrane fusion protein